MLIETKKKYESRKISRLLENRAEQNRPGLSCVWDLCLNNLILLIVIHQRKLELEVLEME